LGKEGLEKKAPKFHTPIKKPPKPGKNFKDARTLTKAGYRTITPSIKLEHEWRQSLAA